MRQRISQEFINGIFVAVHLVVLELRDACIFSGTDTTHPLVREGLEQLLMSKSLGFGAQGCLPHAQVQTQPVVREGLEQLLTGNLLVLKLMYLELMDATHFLRGTHSSQGWNLKADILRAVCNTTILTEVIR
jgi:hypothetical protein